MRARRIITAPFRLSQFSKTESSHTIRYMYVSDECGPAHPMTHEAADRYC